MQKYQNNVVNSAGLAYAGATVLVQSYPALNTVSIYSDNSGTAKANPTTTDTNGQFSFYAADGRYQVTISGPGIATQVISDVLLDDPVTQSYTPAGTGAVATAVQTKLRESVSVVDFGASTSATAAANVTAFQAALNYANSIGGCTVLVPRGTYLLNASILIYKKTILQGEGRRSSILSFSNAGDGIQSTWPINSSTGVWIGVRDIAITNSNGVNIGGGFVDVGGSFVDLHSCHISGFKYEVIFDQTEIATIDNCILESNFASGGLIWLVNGSDHTIGANVGFTNRITITRNQFNCGVNVPWQIIDDGGGAHTIENNNLNAGLGGLRAAGVSGLVFTGNEIEGHTSQPVYLTNTTLAGAYVGPCLAPVVDANTATDANGSHIYVDDVAGGSICRNTFNQATSASITFTNYGSNRASGLLIEGNSKQVFGTFKQAAPFVAGFTAAFQRNVIRQTAATYVIAGISSGANTVTPASMEFIAIGNRLWVSNADGTNGEVVVVSAVTFTTFTATFASIKSDNFVVYGATPNDQYASGIWTPSIFGTGPVGGSTMSVQDGSYNVFGTKCYFNGRVVWSALTGGAAGQLAFNLPIAARLSNQLVQCQVSGSTAVGNTNIFGLTVAGVTTAQTVFINSGTGSLSGTIIGASGTLYVSGVYDI